MVRGDLWHEIQSRFKLKEPKKSIARSLSLSVQTVRKILRQQGPQSYQRVRQKESILARFRDYISQRLAAVGYCARSIYEELQTLGYTGGYDTVKRFVRPLRAEALIQATVRFETPPGQQGQVDWGHCWTILGRRRIKIHLFVMTLGYSRRMFARGAPNERLPNFLQCHQEAFEHFGGLPHEILYDNTRTVVISRDFEGRHIQWNSTFWDFCMYYGFRPRAHRPYRAQTKGKVESGIKYVKRFLRGKVFDSLDHLNASLLTWITNVADQRIHGTLHRKPSEMFLEEQDLLLGHRGRPSYQIQERAVRYVARDCLVTFETNRYSVPYHFVGKPVEVQSEQDLIRIYHEGELIGTHPRCQGRYQNQIHPDDYVGIFPREKPLPLLSGQLLQASVTEEVQVRDLAFYEGLVEGGAP